MIAVLTLVKLDCEFDNIFRITTHERESSPKKMRALRLYKTRRFED